MTLQIELMGETPPTSAASIVTIQGESASDSSSVIHLVNSSGISLPDKHILLQEAVMISDEGPLYTGYLQQHAARLSDCMHKGRFSRRKGIISKLRRSCAALFKGNRRRSRLSGDATAAAGFGGKNGSNQQKKAFPVSPSSESPDSSTEGLMIPVGWPSTAAEDATLCRKSWEDLLREAGVSPTNAADAALLQKAGVLWEAVSASSSQRNSMEQSRGTGSGDGQNRTSTEHRSLAKTSTSSFHDDISVAGARGTKSRGHSRKCSGETARLPRAGSNGSLVELGTSLASSTTRSLGAWFKRRSQEAPSRATAVASPAAAPAAAATGSLAKQQTRQQQQEAPSTVRAGVCSSHFALPIPVQSQGSLLLPQQLQQLRQLAATFGNMRGLLGSSLSTITECSEGSRMMSRRSSGPTAVTDSAAQSLRCSLETGSPKSSPRAGHQQHAFVKLSPLATLPEERLTPVPESSSDAGSPGSGTAAKDTAGGVQGLDTAAGADAGTTATREALMQREQLLAMLSVHKLKAVLRSPLVPVVQPAYHLRVFC